MNAPVMSRHERLALLDQWKQHTPLIRLEHPRAELYLKAEYLNLFGSSKDRSAIGILRNAIQRGDIEEGTTIVESSSGNFALATASMASLLGLPFVPVIDPNCTGSTRTYLELACARVERVDQRDHTGAFLGSRLARVHDIITQDPATFWTNQYSNVDAMEAHYQTTGAELVADAPPLDYVFVGAGTGGTIAGISHRVKEASPSTQVIAVDVIGSMIFGGPGGPRYIPGLGSTIRSALIDQALIDDVVMVSELETVAGCRRLLRDFGIHAGGSTGSVFAAIERTFPHAVAHRPRVAFIAADRGAAYASTVYNPQWVEQKLLTQPDVTSRAA